MAKKEKIASPVKSLKGQEKKYRRQLNKLGRALIKAIKEELLPFLKSQESAYTTDGVGVNLNAIFRRLNQQFTGTIMASFAAQTASGMVEGVGKKNEARFNRSIEGATGINISGVISGEGLEDFVELQISKNVSLIKSLPEEYLKQVEVIVNNGVLNGSRFSTIAKEITAKVGSANSKLAGRIKTIAMNEVQTINAQMSQRRSGALGIKRGIFRTSEDEKVRPCHDELNGVEYDLSKGAWSKTCGRWIIPGVTDINCRCSFSPVIEIS